MTEKRTKNIKKKLKITKVFWKIYNVQPTEKKLGDKKTKGDKIQIST